MKLVRKTTKPSPPIPSEPGEGPSPSKPSQVLSGETEHHGMNPELAQKLEDFAHSEPIPDEPAKPKPGIEPVPLAHEGPEPLKPGEIPTEEQVEQHLDSILSQPLDDNAKYKNLRKYGSDAHRTAREEHSARLKLEQDLEELKKKLVPDEELNQLREARRQLELREVESLPKWSEYDKAVANIASEARSMLLNFSGDKEKMEKTLKVIDERGGLIKFSESDARADGGKNGKDGKPLIHNPDGSATTEKQYFESQIYNDLDPRQRSQFDILTTEARRKQGEKERELEAARQNSKATLDAEYGKMNKAFQDIAEVTAKEFRESELPKLGFAVDKPVLMQSDTAEEKAQKEKVIGMWDSVQKQLSTAYTTPKAITEVRLRAAYYDTVRDELIRVQAELANEKKLRAASDAKWSGMKAVKSLRSITPVSATPRNNTGQVMSTKDALAGAGFKENN